ncbi:excinuclease ABC subunit C [Lewinellaceae bacterium SD302]|nr:excinuclease ABC subunit C [Lewinellaceae bacterium SD302]
MYFVYILYSPSRNRYYVGYTGQLADRFLRHSQGRSKSTKAGCPWVIACLEKFDSASAAYQRENAIKRKKSRKFIEQLCKSYVSNPFPMPA